MTEAQKDRILIVDDTPENIQVVASILQPKEYALSFAKDGFAALEQLQRRKFDLILLDVMMPGMSGFECCEKIHQLPSAKETPVIFLTAKSDSDSVVQGFEVGGVDYITKPFNSRELLARVENHLHLERTKNQLKEANDTKDKLFSMIAHDLRSPISGIQHILSLLISDDYPMSEEEQKTFLLQLNKTVTSTFTLVDNLLMWARSQRGILNVNLEDLEFDEILDAIEDIYQAKAKSKQVELITKVHCDENLRTDREMVTSILRNLLNNAIKFTPKGGRVILDCQHKPEGLEFSVEDSGVGMTPEQLETLFEFVKNKSTIGTAGEKGTGIGLMLCKDFTDKLGGEIRVTSELGKGTRFVVRLPHSQGA